MTLPNWFDVPAVEAMIEALLPNVDAAIQVNRVARQNWYGTNTEIGWRNP